MCACGNSDDVEDTIIYFSLGFCFSSFSLINFLVDKQKQEEKKQNPLNQIKQMIKNLDPGFYIRSKLMGKLHYICGLY